MRTHRLLQRLGVCGATAFVDVQTIGRNADGMHLGTQLVKYRGCNFVWYAAVYALFEAETTIYPI